MALRPAHTCGDSSVFPKLYGLMAALLFLAGVVEPAAAATYYVDVDSRGGPSSDSNPGTIDRPFKTIQKARDVIRGTGENGVTVYLRGGTYRLTAPIDFTAADNGVAGAPNTYRAYPGETPVVSGGKQLTSTWTVYSGSIWKCNVGAERFQSLFVDGVRATRAREPDTGFYYTSGPTTMDSFTFTTGNISGSWTNLDHVEVVYLREWTASRERIASVNGNVVTFQAQPAYQYWALNRYWVENVFEGLDTPGEWYLNPHNGDLYYWPVGGKNPNTSEVICPVVGDTPVRFVGQLLNIKGTDSSYVEYLDFIGITFAHTDWYLPAVGFLGFIEYLEECEVGTGNPAWYGVGPGIILWDARYCNFRNDTFEHIGGNAFLCYGDHVEVTDCDFSDIGAGATKFGTGEGYYGSAIPVSHNTQTGNVMHNLGYVYPVGCGILCMKSGDNTITHNLIYDVGFFGMNIGYYANQTYPVQKNNYVAYNEVHHAQKFLGDAAAIYFVGVQPGTLATHNKVHDCATLKDATYPDHQQGGIAFYIDEGGQGITIRDNWVYRCSQGLFLHMCTGNTIENNVFFTDSRPWACLAYSSYTNNIVRKNIACASVDSSDGYYWTGPGFFVAGSLSVLSESDYNLYYNFAGSHPNFDAELALWKKDTGFEAHSLTNNPLFVNSASDNYNLSSSSPALGLGFQQIDMSNVGPRLASYTVTSSAGTGGSITPSGMVSVAQGGSQTFTIQANTGYSVSSVQVDGVSVGAVSQYTFTNVVANHTISAAFAALPATYTLSVSATNGSVTKTPNQASYTSGQTVSLQASPSTGYNFTGWSGDLTGTANPASLVMNSNKAVTAGFAANSYTLTINATNGSVTKTPNAASYSYGTIVTLQAVPNTGYTFSGWSGDASGTSATTTVTMTANKTVTASFTAVPVTYTLSVSATNGSVTKTPDQASYTSGQTVTLQATPDTGYTFAGWSGDLTGTTNPATLVVNANEAVTANFTAVVVTYTLDVGAVNGAVVKTPDKTSYASGESVTLQAVPNAGYQFAGWSGDLTGTANPATLVMNANKSVTASFVANTYTLSVSAAHGAVTKTPDKTSYLSGETVTLQAVPNTGYKFVSWSGDLTGTANPATLVMNANKTVTASFTSVADQSPPVLGNRAPAPDSIQAPSNTLVTLHLSDDGQGVDETSVSITVDGQLIYSGNADLQRTATGVCYRSGTKADYTYIFQRRDTYGYSREVAVKVSARDLAGNVMPEQTYSFATEMYSFGRNQGVSTDQGNLNQGRPVTVSDSRGNIWVVWQAGNTGARHIYAARFLPDTGTYDPPMQLSRSTKDHCNPVVVTDSAGTLYVAWQENARGVWDVYLSTSTDGVTWLAPKRMVDPAAPANPPFNQTNPALAAGRQASRLVALAWQDDRAGNQDIYVVRSTNTFGTMTVSRVTSDGASQRDPAVAIDGQDTIFVFWTDARNGATDIYGAASNSGPWTNTAVVVAPGNQSQPAVATASTGTLLHLTWVDDRSGNLDVFYATAPGLPAGSLTGTDIVDDTSRADQQAPALAVAAQADGTDRIFACWQDSRNVASSGDTDLYFADLSPDAISTNVLVNDEGTNSNQSEVALAANRDGYPYLVWSDDGGKNRQIFYAGATYMDGVPLAEKEIVAAAGDIIGMPPQNIKTLDDVSVVIPAQACPFDATISIRRMRNPQGYASESLRIYDFGPSGLTFAQPVTITIPYPTRGTGKVRAYWFDSATSAFTDQGVTNVQDIAVASGLHALQFNTTHFTPYLVVEEVPGTTGGSGGGCSLAVGDGKGVAGYFAPYLLLAAIMFVLRRRDGKGDPASSARHEEDTL